MELNDLFVSYKQVDPVSFQFIEPTLPQPIYLNAERAKQVTSEEPAEAEDMSTWSVKGDDMSTWKVMDYGNQLAVPQQTAKQTPQTIHTPADTPAPSAKSSEKALTSANYSSQVKFGDATLPKYWMNKFAALGCSPAHQMAIVSSMYGECGLQPRGAVERKELAGKGNTKKGWAHAGEGAIGFTHWGLKRDIIAKYNADPRRKGPKLSTDEAVYAKPDSRHIVDLDDDDHALMAYLFYEDLIKKTAGMSFDDTIAEFYLQKAGRGFGGKTGTSHDKAMRAAAAYQKSHAQLGYTAASKVNTYLKQLRFAKRLSEMANQSNA